MSTLRNFIIWTPLTAISSIKMLHDARVRRRKCKNAIAWIDFILEQRPERFVENDPSARIVGTRSSDYAPRVLPELFEWENEGQTPTANL